MSNEEEQIKGKRLMLWEIQRQIYAAKLKGKELNEDLIIQIMESLEKQQSIIENNLVIGNYSEIELMMKNESKILNKRIREIKQLKNNLIGDKK